MRSVGTWGIAGFIVLASGLVGAWWLFSRRPRLTPAQREQNRRLMVNRLGRMGDAMIIDVRDDALYYSYEIRGVAYTAAQEFSTLRDRLPEDPSTLIGLAGLKYSPKNPANSILICEEWSGLRLPQLQLQATQTKEAQRE